MLPIHKIVWHEWRESNLPSRVPEPSEAMLDLEQIRSYVKAYEWGGPTSALQLNHLRELSRLIRPGDTILDLACGPGPLLLELATLYPDCRFIGVDLSEPMLSELHRQKEALALTNVDTLCEDIRALPSLGTQAIDVVITTSALHHLPDIESLESTMQRIDTVLRRDGGLFVFDFGLLKSQATRDLLVADVARKAPPLTARDYDHSLRAAFPIDEVERIVRRSFSRPIHLSSSLLVDFFYFLTTPPRTQPSRAAANYIGQIWRELSLQNKIEHMLLRILRSER